MAKVVFSAHAEMFPVEEEQVFIVDSILRACGDGSNYNVSHGRDMQYSPHCGDISYIADYDVYCVGYSPPVWRCFLFLVHFGL